jgi:phage shock protein B
MSDNLTAVIIVAIVFLGPSWIFYQFMSRGRNARQRSAQEAADYANMAEIAQRLEQRVATLEQILDAEVPSWRSGPANFARQTGRAS